MNIPSGFALFPGVNLAITLETGAVVQGQLLAAVKDRDTRQVETVDAGETEFLLLQLICPVFIFGAGATVLLNVAKALLIAPAPSLCA